MFPVCWKRDDDAVLANNKGRPQAYVSWVVSACYLMHVDLPCLIVEI